MSECPGCRFRLVEQNPSECPDCGLSFEGGPDLAFTKELRRLTDRWRTPPEDLMFDPPEHGHPLIAWMDICAADGSGSVLTVGVHFDGGSIRGDKLHNQLFHLPATPTDLAIHQQGPPDLLAGIAASWLSKIADRPLVRYEWDTNERVEYRVVLAATGAGLSETRDCPPPGTRPDRISPVPVRY